MSSDAYKLLEMNEKRLTTLKKSLEKKKKALKIQEDIFAQETKGVEENPTYLYYKQQLAECEVVYQRRLEDLEREFQKKTKYFEDAITALREKSKEQKPTGKVYRRLQAEVAAEQKEYDNLSKELDVARQVAQQRDLEIRKREAAARLREEQRKEQEEKQRALEEYHRRREAERSAEEQRARERTEDAKRLLAEESKKNLGVGGEGGGVNSFSRLERINLAKTTEELGEIYNASKKNKDPFSAEEDARWEERFSDLEAQENAKRDDETINSIVSDPVEPVRKNYFQMTREELFALDLSTVPESDIKLITMAIESKTPAPAPAPFNPPPANPKLLTSTIRRPGKMTVREMNAKGLLAA